MGGDSVTVGITGTFGVPGDKLYGRVVFCDEKWLCVGNPYSII